MITVKDIREKEFGRVKHGYNEDQVDDFLDEIADQLEALVRENQAMVKRAEEAESAKDEAERQLDAAREQAKAAVPAAQEQPAPAPIAVPVLPESASQEDSGYFRNLEATLRETLLSAQRIADETVSEARKKAKQMVAEAQEQASSITSAQKAEKEAAQAELDGIRKTAEEYRGRFIRMVQEQMHILKADESVEQ